MGAVDLYKYNAQNTEFYYSAPQLRKKLDSLIMNRSSLNWHWNNVLNVVKPSKSAIDYFRNQAVAGNPIVNYQDNFRALYDNHGSVSSLLLASYLHSSLTNPHDEWMKIESRISRAIDKVFSEETNDVNWEMARFREQLLAQACGDQMHLEWRSSNFHQENFMFFKWLVDIGTACMCIYKINKGGVNKLRFMTKDMFDIYFTEDVYGMANHTFCIYKWTARQVINYFAKGWTEFQIKMYFGDRILKAYKDWSDDIFVFIHAVYPDQGSNKDKYISSYFMYEGGTGNSQKDWEMGYTKDNNYGNTFLKNENMDFNPYIVSRIRKDGMFGVGFSEEAFPLLLQLQEIQRSILIAVQKNVEPALKVPSERYGKVFGTQPNQKNPYEIFGNQLIGAEPVLREINIQHPAMAKTDLKNEIDRIFLLDKITIEQVKRNRTATEVEKRTAEEIKLLSPFLGALETEFLHPLADTTFQMLRKSPERSIKIVFDTLAQVGFGFKYVSDIAKAQTQKQVQGVMELYQYLSIMSEKEPGVAKLVNWVEAAKLVVSGLNSPRLILNDPQTFQKELAALQQRLNAETQAAMITGMKDAGAGYKSFQEGEATRQNTSNVSEAGGFYQ